MPQIYAEMNIQGPLDGWMSDRIDRSLALIDVSPVESDALGYAGAELVGSHASAIYDERSLASFVPLLLEPRHLPACRLVTLRAANGETIEKAAFIYAVDDDAGPVAIEVIKVDAPDFAMELTELRQSNSVMWDIIQTAREAIWCIEYIEPVDVHQPLESVIDGIFESRSVWSLCNAAMARAYDLPDAANMPSRSVNFHWPRNEVNEAFIRQVIASDFHVDGAISEDHRSDGSAVLMENDVRAQIINGKLRRLWGTLRELSGTQAPALAAPATNAFDLLPIAAAAIGADGRTALANDLWHARFSASPDAIGLQIYHALVDDAGTASAGGLAPAITMVLRDSSGLPQPYRIHGRWRAQPAQEGGLLVVTATIAGEEGAL